MRNPNFSLFAAAFISLVSPSVFAAAIWSGGSSSTWSVAGNWDALPVATNTLTFGGNPANQPTTNDLPLAAYGISPTTLAVSFTNDGTAGKTAAFTVGTLGVSNKIQLAYHVGASAVTTGPLITAVINLDMDMSGGNRSISPAANHGITVNGVIGQSTSTARNLTANGSGSTAPVILSGLNTFTGSVSVLGTLSVNTIFNSGTPSAIGVGVLSAATTIQIGSSSTSGVLIYTGAATSTDRKVQIGSGAAASSTGNATIQNDGGGALTFSNANFNVLDLIATGARRITLRGSNAGNNTITGIIADNNTAGGGTVALTKDDAASTWTLSGGNSYTGLTTVTAGTLKLNHASALGSATGATTISSGGVLDLNGLAIVGEALTIAGTGISTNGVLINTGGNASWSGLVTLGSFSTQQITTTVTGNITLSGGVAESAAGKNLTKAGEGTLSIGGSSTYTGITKISAGTLAVSAPAALASGSTLSSGGNIGDTTTLQLTSPSASYAMSALSVGGIMRFTSPGGASTLTFANPSNQTGSSEKRLDADSNTTVVINSTFDLIGSTATADRSIRLQGAGNFVFNGALQNNASGAAALFKGGFNMRATGMATLNASNTYTSITTVGGGVVKLNNADALPGGTGGSGVGTSYLNFDGDSTVAGVIGLTAASGDFTRAIDTTVSPATVTTGNLVRWGLSGGARGGFAAFGGNRSVNFGGAAAQVTWSSGNGIFGGGLILSDAASDSTVTVVNPISLGSGTRTVIVNDGSAALDAILSGVLSNSAGNFIKEGTGTLSLTGANTYGGNTTVSAGSLIVNTAYFADASTLTIASGAVLNLTHGTADTVAALILGGVTQPAGTYTSSTPGGFITGSGSITVVVGGYANWKGPNAGGQDSSFDFDTDGVSNGVEYFMNAPAGFTANPALVETAGPVRKVTWSNGGNIPSTAYGTQYVVQTSPDLAIWTNVLAADTNLSNLAGSVAYTLPTGAGKTFVRLSVTPN